MAQTLCARSLVAAPLVKAAGLPSLSKRNVVSMSARSQKFTVSASLKSGDVVQSEIDVVATAVAASVFSALASAPAASAAQVVAELADDSRPYAILGLILPALGWVLFNIGKPALNQLNKMQSQKGFIGALGLGAAATAGLTLADNADAAQLVGDLAADNRPLVLLLPVAAALGWVLFNIAVPALNQLKKMTGGSLPLPSLTIKSPTLKKGTAKSGTVKTVKKAVIGAIGLSGAMALADSADAAQEVASLAADNRPLILLFVVAPALGWVLFNILRPGLNQLSKMVAAQGKAK